MKKALALPLMLVLLSGGGVAAAQDEEFPHGRAILANGGYQYDDTASLIQAMRDDNPMVAVAAATFLVKHRPTPAIVVAFREASESPSGAVAMMGFRALFKLRESGWEDAAVGRMHHDPRERTLQLDLAGVLADAGRSEGWPIVRAALAPDNRGLGVAMSNAVRFHGLKDATGAEIDVVAELGRLRKELQQRGGSADDLYRVDVHTVEADARGRERRRTLPR